MKQRLGSILTALALGLTAHAQTPRLIIGAVYVGGVNDYGYNRSFHDALTQVARDLPGVKLLEAENVPESGEAERVMEGMIQHGARLIFPTSFGYQDSARKTAKRHPEVCFEYAGDGAASKNFGVFFGSTQAAWYPMGVAAGRMTKSGKLGFVIGMPIGYALGNVNAFEMGARSVNPKATTIVVVTGGGLLVLSLFALGLMGGQGAQIFVGGRHAAGGVDRGYRTFSLLENVTAGKWRVNVKTPEGQIIGRMDFNVTIVSSTPALSTKNIN